MRARVDDELPPDRVINAIEVARGELLAVLCALGEPHQVGDNDDEQEQRAQEVDKEIGGERHEDGAEKGHHLNPCTRAVQ